MCKPEPCFLCDNPEAIRKGFDNFEFDCPECRVFEVTGTLYNSTDIIERAGQNHRKYLSIYVRLANEEGRQKITLYSTNYESDDPSHFGSEFTKKVYSKMPKMYE